MTQLNDHQVAAHVVAGGFVGDNRVVGVAVVLAESRGRTDAKGDVSLQTDKWGPSIGLFQIRSLKAQKGSGGTRDELANLDPATNARHAHVIFMEAGGRWTPWSTFKNNLHDRFMDRARTAVAAVASRPDLSAGVVEGEGLSMADASEIMSFLQRMRQDMVVRGTNGLENTVEDFATRQRQIIDKLERLDRRLAAIEQRLGPPS